MKGGGTEIEGLLTFERNSFNESKNFKISNSKLRKQQMYFATSATPYIEVMSKTLNIAMANYYSETYFLKS